MIARSGAAANVVVETSHRESLVPLAVAGAGTTIVPASMAADAERQGAVVRPLRPPITRRVGILHRRGPRSPAADAMLALARSTTFLMRSDPRPRCYTAGRSLGSGVTGNTAVSGTVIQGSIPCSPAHRTAGRPRGAGRSPFPGRWRPSGALVVCWGYSAPSSSGLGHHPLKVAARVRIPLGLPRNPRSEALSGVPLPVSGSVANDMRMVHSGRNDEGVPRTPRGGLGAARVSRDRPGHPQAALRDTHLPRRQARSPTPARRDGPRSGARAGGPHDCDGRRAARSVVRARPARLLAEDGSRRPVA